MSDSTGKDMLGRCPHMIPRRSIFMFACFGVTMLIYYQYEYLVPKTLVGDTIPTNHHYLVYTNGCYIPKIDPMDKSIKKYLSQLKPLKCTFGDQLVVVSGDLLQVNWTVVRLSGKNITYCKYYTIYRKRVGSDDQILFKPAVSFTHRVVLREGDDLLQVECFTDTVLTYTRYLTTIVPRKDVKERCAQNRAKIEENVKQHDRFDIVMLGVDSVSLSGSLRFLKATREIILNETGGIDFKGYHKVGDNTLPNAVAFLTGKTDKEFFKGRSHNNYLVKRDDMIWANYSQSGYVTLDAEDRPAVFNYQMRGFHRIPTDYYMRPFILHTQKSKAPKPTCADGWLHIHRVLEWTNLFSETFSDDPHFSFAFLSGMTHDYIHQMSLVDEPIFQFVRRLRDSGAFRRRTILILLADHGMRFGNIRKTYVGGLEDRLPMMYMVFPEWFPERYPTQWRNLQVNAARLTTPFDIHATLIHVLTAFDPASAPSSPHGYSLLHEQVPTSRTCELASIPTEWCACHSQQVLSPNDSIVVRAAETTVQWLNEQLSAKGDLCAILKLDTISRGTYINPSKELQGKREVSSRRLYRVNFRTVPGGGEFESTVQLVTASHDYTVFPDIGRVNAYGNTSSCIRDLTLRKYCYCKSNLGLREK